MTDNLSDWFRFFFFDILAWLFLGAFAVFFLWSFRLTSRKVQRSLELAEEAARLTKQGVEQGEQSLELQKREVELLEELVRQGKKRNS